MSTYKAVLAGAAAAAVLAVAPSSQAASSLGMNITFSATGLISFTLPSGTPVGTTSGSPTVIPAGYYTLTEQGPGGCSTMPHFTIKGPGVYISDNLNEGESETVLLNTYFNPSSTYTWTSDAQPSVVHTFVTTSDVQAAAPTNNPTGLSSNKHGTVSSTDLVNSANLFRGILKGTVATNGKLLVSFGGKTVKTLKPGRYTLVVTDDRTTTGFVLQHGKYTAVQITSKPFVGTRRYAVALTTGTWYVRPFKGASGLTLSVSS